VVGPGAAKTQAEPSSKLDEANNAEKTSSKATCAKQALVVPN
jgi:hypothetical protein